MLIKSLTEERAELFMCRFLQSGLSSDKEERIKMARLIVAELNRYLEREEEKDEEK